jgi:heme/copper-type cytochrome/quinol oxidase subunit 2
VSTDVLAPIVGSLLAVLVVLLLVWVVWRYRQSDDGKKATGQV